MPGGVTRLLACDTEELKTYRGLHLGPTFVHQNHKRIWHTRALGPGETAHPFGAQRNDSSGSYNKPGSIMHWNPNYNPNPSPNPNPNPHPHHSPFTVTLTPNQARSCTGCARRPRPRV